ncbi:ATP-binding protein [Desulfococcaceae bacterium HSG8]|nr:ATP-binding protein [Desulfococcaceae bacterium HSG8]
MKELTIISGKGGTGKTSLVASFAALAENKVIVDADVDAADMHLVLEPSVKREAEFMGGHTAQIRPDICNQCGECRERCQFDAVSDDFVVDSIACEGCGVCVHFCPADAIEFPRRLSGKWFVSETRNGPMIHARLGIAEENSGMLVSLLRKEARKLADKKRLEMIITDGPPGIGCPVIASVTGSDAVLIITEPTLSGLHDMKRVGELADFLKVPALLTVNKYDLNPEITRQIESFSRENHIVFTGTIPYDPAVTSAMVAKKSLVEFSDTPAALAIRNIWERVSTYMQT